MSKFYFGGKDINLDVPEYWDLKNDDFLEPPHSGKFIFSNITTEDFQSLKHVPPVGDNFGMLEIIKYEPSNKYRKDARAFWYPTSDGWHIWYCSANMGGWSKWYQLVNSEELQKLQTQINELKNKIGGVIKELYIKLFSCFFGNRKAAI